MHMIIFRFHHTSPASDLKHTDHITYQLFKNAGNIREGFSVVAMEIALFQPALDMLFHCTTVKLQ